eukprot:TRINITY_DN9345_c0_g1_i2.p2 TRINITY_DN9345_c0_g1~~TRINITY_DN9345_c0_g1_i2.p2  ORF type:complete len:102 (+),score=3.31 TRINITY_DN9345_c0_g1_i2:678-983(+)
MYGQSLLKNVLSLREVYLEIWPEDDVSVESLTVLESWLKGNYHVNVLKLSCFCIEVLSFSRIEPSYISKTQCLILESELRRSELPGMANFLCVHMILRILL